MDRVSIDNDLRKGATEDESPVHRSQSQSSLAGQLPHRTADPMIKESDSDFPEPGSSVEHTGQEGAKPQGGRAA